MRCALLVLVVGLLTVGIVASDRPTAPSTKVRLAVVHTPESSGLLKKLLPEFEKQGKYSVVIDSREDVYDAARTEQADLVISHYGHSGTESFVTEGLGLWPHPVFANQAALIGPTGDPAVVGGLQDAAEAFRRIARTESLFVVNNAPTEKYLGDVLWHAAGKPDKKGWYSDQGLRNKGDSTAAVAYAAKQKGYLLWGLVPFLKYKEAHPDCELKALVIGDPLFQRLMVCVRVNPEKVKGVNSEGAQALESYLIAPETQARVRAFRMPGLEHQVWWPAARNNSGSFLKNR